MLVLLPKKVSSPPPNLALGVGSLPLRLPPTALNNDPDSHLFLKALRIPILIPIWTHSNPKFDENPVPK